MATTSSWVVLPAASDVPEHCSYDGCCGFVFPRLFAAPRLNYGRCCVLNLDTRVAVIGACVRPSPHPLDAPRARVKRDTRAERSLRNFVQSIAGAEYRKDETDMADSESEGIKQTGRRERLIIRFPETRWKGT
ncbi:hypothetical protein MRX96_002869 [Rhipicephalus microplus]